MSTYAAAVSRRFVLKAAEDVPNDILVKLNAVLDNPALPEKVVAAVIEKASEIYPVWIEDGDFLDESLFIDESFDECTFPEEPVLITSENDICLKNASFWIAGIVLDVADRDEDDEPLALDFSGMKKIEKPKRHTTKRSQKAQRASKNLTTAQAVLNMGETAIKDSAKTARDAGVISASKFNSINRKYLSSIKLQMKISEERNTSKAFRGVFLHDDNKEDCLHCKQGQLIKKSNNRIQALKASKVSNLNDMRTELYNALWEIERIGKNMTSKKVVPKNVETWLKIKGYNEDREFGPIRDATLSASQKKKRNQQAFSYIKGYYVVDITQTINMFSSLHEEVDDHVTLTPLPRFYKPKVNSGKVKHYVSCSKKIEHNIKLDEEAINFRAMRKSERVYSNVSSEIKRHLTENYQRLKNAIAAKRDRLREKENRLRNPSIITTFKQQAKEFRKMAINYNKAVKARKEIQELEDRKLSDAMFSFRILERQEKWNADRKERNRRYFELKEEMKKEREGRAKVYQNRVSSSARRRARMIEREESSPIAAIPSQPKPFALIDEEIFKKITGNRPSNTICAYSHPRREKLLTRPEKKTNRVLFLHEHLCIKCNRRYSHSHKYDGDHHQSQFQCPWKGCEWYYKRGSDVELLNKTRSYRIEHPSLDDQWTKELVSDTWGDWIGIREGENWHVNGRVAVPMPEHWVNANHVYYKKGDAYVYPAHVDQYDPRNIHSNSDFCHKGVDIGDVTEYVYIGKPGQYKTKVGEKTYDIDYFIGNRRFVQKCKRIKFNMNLKSGTPVFNECGKLCSIVTCSLNCEHYYLMNPKNQTSNVPTIYNQWHSDYPPGWIEGDYVEYRSGNKSAFSSHCKPWEEHDIIGIHYNNLNVGVITDYISVKRPDTTLIRVNPDKINVKYQSSNKAVNQTCRFFVSKEWFKAGTPIWNDEGELCSLITGHVKNNDGFLYPLFHRNNKLNVMEDNMLVNWHSNSSVSLPMPHGWEDKGSHIEFEGKSMDGNDIKVLPIHAIKNNTTFEGDSDVHVQNITLTKPGACLSVALPGSNCRSLSSSTIDTIYRVGQKVYRRSCRWFTDSRNLKSGTPLWTENDALCSIVTCSLGDKYLVMTVGDNCEEVENFAVDWHSDGWELVDGCYEFNKESSYMKLKHKDPSTDDGLFPDVLTNLEFANCSEYVYVGFSKLKRVVSSKLVQHRGVTFKCFKALEGDSFTSGSPIFNEEHNLCGVVCSSFNSQYFAIETNNRISEGGTNIGNEEDKHHYVNFLSEKVIKLDGDNLFVEKTKGPEIRIARYSRFIRLEKGYNFINEAKKKEFEEKFEIVLEEHDYFCSHYNNDSVTFSTENKDVFLIRKALDTPVFLYGRLYKSKNDIRPENFLPGLYFIAKDEGGVQVQEVSSQGDIIFNFHFAGSFTNEKDILVADTEHSFFKTILLSLFAVASAHILRAPLPHRLSRHIPTARKVGNEFEFQVENLVEIGKIARSTLDKIGNTTDPNWTLELLDKEKSRLRAGEEEAREWMAKAIDYNNLIIFLTSTFQLNETGPALKKEATDLYEKILETEKQNSRRKEKIEHLEKELNDLKRKVMSYSEQIKYVADTIQALLAFIKSADSEIQSIRKQIEDYYTYQADSTTNIDQYTAEDYKAKNEDQAKTLNSFSNNLAKLKVAISKMHQLDKSTPKRRSADVHYRDGAHSQKVIAHCGELEFWLNNATNCIGMDGIDGWLCLNTAVTPAVLISYDEAKCLCDELFRFSHEHVSIYVEETEGHCKNENYHRCHLHFDSCVKGNQTENIVAVIEKQVKHFGFPSITSILWYTLVLVFSFFLAGKKGFYAALICFLFLVVPTPAAAHECSVEGSTYVATTETGKVWRVVGNWRVGSCIHFGNTTLVVTNITTNQAYIMTNYLAGKFHLRTMSEYGCPGGDSSAICDEKPKLDTQCDFVYDTCTHDYNTMWDGTSCAFNGDLYIRSKTCVNVTRTAEIYQRSTATMSFEIVFHNFATGKIIKAGDENYKYQDMRIEHVKTAKIQPAKFFINYEKTVYVVIDDLIVRDACTCNSKDRCVPNEDKCKTLVVKQNHHLLDIRTNSEEWLGTLGSSRLPIANMVSFENGHVVQDLESVSADLVVEDKIISQLTGQCSSVENKTFSVEKGESQNYHYSAVTFSIVQDDCSVIVNCDNCHIVSSKIVPIKGSKGTFKLLCGFYNSDRCSISSLSNSWVIELSELNSNPNLKINQVYDSITSKLQDVSMKIGFSKFYEKISEIGNKVLSFIPLHKILYYAMFAFLVWLSITFFMGGNYIFGVSLCVLAIVPLVSAEEIGVVRKDDCLFLILATALFALRLVRVEIFVLYILYSQALTSVAQVFLVFVTKANDIIDYFRTDYEVISRRVNMVENVILAIASLLHPGFLVLVCVKQYRKIINALWFSETRIRSEDAIPNSPIVCTLSSIWPKKKVEEKESVVEYHSSDRNCVKLSFLVSELKDTNIDRENIPILHPETGKRMFFVSYFKPGILCAPAHAIENDMPSCTKVVNDSLFFCSNAQGIEDLISALKCSKCINYKKMTCAFKPGDSGRIFWGEQGSLYIHSGVLKNGAPVCCYCGLEHTYHDDTSKSEETTTRQAATTPKRSAIAKLKPKVMPKESLLPATSHRMTTVNSKHGTLVLNHGFATGKVKGINLIEKTKEEKKKDHDQHVLRLEKQLRKIKQNYWDDWFSNVVGRNFEPDFYVGETDSQFVFRHFQKDQETLEKLYKAAVKRASELGLSIKRGETYAIKADYVGRVHDASKTMTLRFKALKLEAVKGNLPPPQVVMNGKTKVVTIMDGQPIIAPRSAIRRVKPAATLPSVKHNSDIPEFDSVFDLFNNECSPENPRRTPGYVYALHLKCNSSLIFKKSKLFDVIQKHRHYNFIKENINTYFKIYFTEFDTGLSELDYGNEYIKANIEAESRIAEEALIGHGVADVPDLVVEWKAIAFVKTQNGDCPICNSLNEDIKELDEMLQSIIDNGVEEESEVASEVSSVKLENNEVAEEAVNDSIEEASNASFRDHLLDRIHDRSRYNTCRIIHCADSGQKLGHTNYDETWMNDTSCTQIATLVGPTNGHGFFYGGSFRTCYHCVEKGNVVVAYHTSPSFTSLREAKTSNVVAEVALSQSKALEVAQGDIAIYDIDSRSKELRKPKSGEDYICVDVERKMFFTLRHKGTKTMKDGKIYDIFAHVDITKQDGEQIIPIITNLAGASGTPILDKSGHPVGVWGTSTITSTNEGDIEVSLTRTYQKDTKESIQIDVKDIINKQKEAAQSGKILRIKGATGSGKTTRMPLAIAQELYKVTGKRIIIYVLIPQRVACDMAYNYVSEQVFRQNLSKIVEVRCEHGKTKEESRGMSSWKYTSDPKITITYKTFGSAAFSIDTVKEANLIILDEVHQKDNSQVQAVLEQVKDLGLTNCLALTATPYVGENCFVDMVLPSIHPYSIENVPMKSVVYNDKGELPNANDYFVINYPRNTKNNYAINRKYFEEGGRTIVFCPTKNDCAFYAKEFEGFMGYKTAVFTSEKQDDISEKCMIFATDVIESSATITGVNNIIDLGVANRPSVSFEIEGQKIFLTENFEIVQVNECQAQQRRGRTGRTCNGYYHHVTTDLSKFDPFPTAPCLEAAVLLIAAGYEFRDQSESCRKTSKTYYKLINPLNDIIQMRYKEDRETLSDFVRRMQTRARDSMSCEVMSQTSFYLTHNLPHCIARFPELFGKEVLTNGWNGATALETCVVDMNENNGVIIDNDFFNVFRTDAVKKQAREDRFKDPKFVEKIFSNFRSKKAIEEVCGLDDYRINSLTQPVVLTITAITAGSYIAWHIKNSIYGDRRISKILQIPCRESFDEKIFEPIRNFGYCDMEYHKDKAMKVTEMAKSIWKVGSNKIRNVCYAIIKASGSEELIKWFESRFYYNLNSSEDWLALLDQWCRGLMTQVQSFDFSSVEHLGLLAIFPAISAFFNTCCAKYGEIVTTVGTSLFSVWVNATIGNQTYIVATGATLLMNLIRNSIFLSEEDTDYSPNLAMAMVAVPFGVHMIKKLFSNEQAIVYLKETVNNNTTAAVATAAVSSGNMLTFGSGGADSGFAAAMTISSILKDGLGNSTSEQVETLLTVVLRTYNLTSLNIAGFTTMGVTVMADLLVTWFLSYVEQKTEHEADNIKVSKIAEDVYEKLRDDKKGKIELFKRLYDIAKITVGALVNPWSIPFMAVSVFIRWVQFRTGGNALDQNQLDEFIRIAQRQIFVSPIACALNMAYQSYRLMNAGIEWSSGIEGVGSQAARLASGVIYRCNSEKGFLATVITTAKQWLGEAFDSIKECAKYISGMTIIKFFKAIICPIVKLIRAVKNGIVNATNSIKLCLRDIFITSICPEFVATWMMKRPATRSSSVQVAEDSDIKLVLSTLNRFGLNSISNYIARKLQEENHYNFFSVWAPDDDLNNLRYYNTLGFLHLDANGVNLATVSNALPVHKSLTLSKISRRNAMSELLKIARIVHYQAAHDVHFSCKGKELDEVLGKRGFIVNITVTREDLIVLFYEEASAKWKMVFMGPYTAHDSKDCYILTTDNVDCAYKNDFENCENQFLKKLYLDFLKRSADIKTKTFEHDYIERYHWMQLVVDRYCARLVNFDGDALQRAIKISCSLTPFDHTLVNSEDLGYLIHAKMALIREREVFYAEHLNFVDISLNLDDFTDIRTVDSVPSTNAKIEIRNTNFLTSSRAEFAIENYFVKTLSSKQSPQYLMVILNIVTGRDVFYTDDSSNNYLQDRFTVPGNDSCIIIKNGQIYESLAAKGGVRSLPLVTTTPMNRFCKLDKNVFTKDLDEINTWIKIIGDKFLSPRIVNKNFKQITQQRSIAEFSDYTIGMNLAGILTCPPTTTSAIVYTNTEAPDSSIYLPIDILAKGGIRFPSYFGKAFAPANMQLDRMTINSIIFNNSIEENLGYVVLDEETNTYAFVQKPIYEAIIAIRGEFLGYHVVRNNHIQFEEFAEFTFQSGASLPVDEFIHFPDHVDSFIVNVSGSPITPKSRATIRINKPQLKYHDLTDVISKKAFSPIAFLPEMSDSLKIPTEADAPEPKLVIPCLLATEAQKIVFKSLDPKRRLFMDKKEKQYLDQLKKPLFPEKPIEYEPMPRGTEIKLHHYDSRSIKQYSFSERKALLKKSINVTLNDFIRAVTPKVGGTVATPEQEDAARRIVEAEIHREEEKDEEHAFNTNSKKSYLSSFVDWFRGNNLVNATQVRVQRKKNDLSGLVNNEIMAHDKITKDVAKAIFSLNPQSPDSIMVDLPFIVHFDRVSKRRMNYDEPDSYDQWLKPAIEESVPLGANIEWACSQNKLPTAIKVSDKDCQQTIYSLDGFLKGHEWEVMKRKGRVWLPQNEDLGTNSKGFMKAAQLDRDTRIFSSAQKVLDLSAGAGGFEYYMSTCKPKAGREVVFTTLTRPGHVNFQQDVFANTDPRFFKLRKIEHGNGDFRYADIYDIAKKQMPCKYDLIILDCGESSSRLDKEGNWMFTAHTIQNRHKERVISEKPAFAVEKYIDLIKTGGSGVFKIMGYTEGSRKFVRLLVQHFRKCIMYKMPTSSYASREWYLVCTGKTDTPQSWPNIDSIIDHAKYIWLQKLNEFHDWSKKNVKIFTKDLKENGPVGFGLGLALKKKTMHDVEKRHGHLNSHCHACAVCGFLYVHAHDFKFADHRHEFACPRRSCDMYWGNRYAENKFDVQIAHFNYKEQIIETKKRPTVPVYSYVWKTPEGKWIKIGPQQIEDTMKENTIGRETEELPFPEEWTCFGETFKFQMKERAALIKEEVKKNGYHILPPSKKFENIYEPFRISFKEKYGKEKHTSNMLIGDLMFNVFGLTPATSVIGHTQCTKELLDAAHKKRLDLCPKEPSPADQKILFEAAKANCTPEYWAIANGPDHKKFKPWTYEEAINYINNQGAGGHFDKWCKFKDAVVDPKFKEQVLRRISDFEQGKPVATYQTCRDKRETKAKKNIMADGRLKIDEPLDACTAAYHRLNAEEKKKRREERVKILYESANISPRNIRYSEFVQRFVDLMILGPYQQHHNNVAKMYMGSTTGTPLWKLGDLLRGIYEVYVNNEQKEFIIGDKIIEGNRKEFSKEFLTEHDRRNVKIELFSDAHTKNVMRRIELAMKHQIASGDFSGWDGTVNNTDHANEYVHLKRVYQEKSHTLLKNRMCVYMTSFTITDNGHVVAGWGQRGSGDQQTSSGNTFHNDILHVAAAAVSQGRTVWDICKPIGIIWYRVNFDGKPKWKKYYLREMSNVADGDDNNHFAKEDLIQLLNTTGVQFIERCGKKIRCGTRSGYDINTRFEDLSYCSHTFTRVRKAACNSKLYKEKEFNNTSIVDGERPMRWGEKVNYDNSLVKKTYELVKKELDVAHWTLVHQRVYDALNDLIVTYMPLRNLPEIVGKLTYTIKNEVISFHFNRSYGKTKKDQKEALKNERAMEITRGKTLAYLLNYIHIESVRILVGGIMSIIGDGTCNLTELKKRFNVPSSTTSMHTAMKSVFDVDNINQIETIARQYDCAMLKNLNYNCRQQFETCKIQDGVGCDLRLAPRTIPDLTRAVKRWVDDYSHRQQIKPDPYFMTFIMMTEERKKAVVVSKPKKNIAMPMLLRFWMTIFSVQAIKLVIVKSDLTDLPAELKDQEIRIREKLTYSPDTGDSLDFRNYKIIFVKHLHKANFKTVRKTVQHLLDNAPKGSSLVATKTSRQLNIVAHKTKV